jgi:Amidohydrolase family
MMLARCSRFASSLAPIGTLLLLSACSASRPRVTAITHVTVIDATGAPPHADFTVLVSGTQISAIGPSSSVSVPGDAQVPGGVGKFLIPGLVDMHLHLTGAGEPAGSREFFFPLLVANGITTVRDMGGRVDLLKALRDEIAKGKRLGPQIFFTGPYLDGDPPSFQPSIVIQSPAEAIAAVRSLKEQGVDFIKVQSRLQPEGYFAIAEESKRLGIRFVGHVPDAITAAQASEAGQASIEHLTGVLLGCSTREEELRQRQLQPVPPGENRSASLARQRAWQRDLLNSISPQKSDALLRKFAANRTWHVPTFPLLVHTGFLTPETDLRNDPRSKYVPRNLLEIWEQGRKASLEGYSAEDFALRREIVKRSLKIVGRMNAAGVRLMTGTDSAAPNVFPGSSVHEDLAYLVAAGLTPMQALQAATSGPAEFLMRNGQGTIQAGKRADLVLLDANPLDDIHNTQKIRAVILNGKLLTRSHLDALLAGVQRFASTH